MIPGIVAALVAITDPGTAERVSIWIAQSGLHGTRRSELTLTKDGEGYSDGSRLVPGKYIAALVRAALAAPVPALDPERLPVDANDLRAEAAETAGANYPPKTAARFLAWVTDTANRPALISYVFDSWHTDDVPDARVDISLSDGSRIALSSTSQNPFM